METTKTLKVMTARQKLQISGALQRYIHRFPAVTDAAAALKGVTLHTINKVAANAPGISADVWQHIAAQVGYYCGDWQTADTGVALYLRSLCTYVRYTHKAHAFVAQAGTGKTYTALRQVRQHPETFYIAGSHTLVRQHFLDTLAAAAGIDAGLPFAGKVAALKAAIRAMHAPLIIIDDAHKLKDRVLLFATQLLACMGEYCGFVLLGNPQLRQRINPITIHQGLAALLKKNWHQPVTPLQADFMSVCRVNGVTTGDAISDLARQCNCGMHGLRELIQNRRTLPNAA